MLGFRNHLSNMVLPRLIFYLALFLIRRRCLSMAYAKTFQLTLAFAGKLVAF